MTTGGPAPGAAATSGGGRVPTGRERSGRLVGQVLERLDEATRALTGAATAQDVATARAAVLDARQALTHLARPGDVVPASDRPSVLRRTELSASPSAARAARAFSRDTCERWAVPAAVTSAVTDLAGELVANAARHGEGPVVLAVELGAGQVSVSVYDDAPGRPELLPYRPGVSDHGLGLHLVQRLSDRWGWTGDGGGGKWVWARVSLPPEASPEQVLPGSA